MPGQLIISLDFELLWGVRDHADRASYGGNIIGAREAIPHILELFDSTWYFCNLGHGRVCDVRITRRVDGKPATA